MNFTNQPVVQVEDSGGNLVSSSASITLTASSGTLSCTTNPKNASGGVATFAGCNLVGTATSGYSLTAASTGLTGATSSTFSLSTGSATKLVFTTSPGSSTNGVNFTNQPVVQVEDSGGNLVSSSASITLTASSGTLSCTTNPKNASGGVATFAGCNLVGTATSGYSLTAASTGLTGATSSTFSLSTGSATKLVFTTSPGSSTNGVNFTNQPVVQVEDSGATRQLLRLHHADRFIGHAELHHQPARCLGRRGHLRRVQPRRHGHFGLQPHRGQYRADRRHLEHLLAVHRVGHQAGLHHLSGQLDQRRELHQPAGGPGRRLRGQPRQLLRLHHADRFIGHAELHHQPAERLGRRGHLRRVQPRRHGHFGLQPHRGQYRADRRHLDTFSLSTGSATKLVFTTSPGSSTNGVNFTDQPVVQVEDSGGNLVTGSSASITLTASSGTLSCTTNPLAASGGVATFAGCNLVGTATSGYSLTAACTGLTGATSSTFSLSTGSATKLVFTTSPGSTTNGVNFTDQPVVQVEDSGGNLVSSSASLTLTASSGTLSCTTNPVNASGGVATFAGCNLSARPLRATASPRPVPG